MENWLEAFARTAFRRSGDTAHDLKTPLNVAVLNLELLRMRVAKLANAGNDEKIAGYAKSIELELRRMASICDTFFLLSSPPKQEGQPIPVDISPMCNESAVVAGVELRLDSPLYVLGHESRIRQAVKMFFEGAGRVLRPEGRGVSAGRNEQRFQVAVSGRPQNDDFEVTKIFKFYYTDPSGNPDLSLAAARLIAETYGGELNASQEHDNVTFRLSFPPGE